MASDLSDLPPAELTKIDALVEHYKENHGPYRRFVTALHGQISDSINPDNGHSLVDLIHSVKYRIKDPEHLRTKLARKYRKCAKDGKEFPYTVDNLFSTVTDLGGYRILHLHTRQFKELNSHLIPILEESHKIVEGPIAKVWDHETKAYFESIDVLTEDNPRMYSSVHYLLQPNSTRKITIELQVRTLADEIWGEIDHQINYPEQHELLACREQIRALARLTSGCSRLVDSVMATHEDWERVRRQQVDAEL